MFQVKAFLDPNQNLYHTLFPLSGLMELSDLGEIELRLVSLPKGKRASATPGNVCLQFEVKSGSSAAHLIVCDLRDQSDFTDSELLKNSSLYFKRGYYEPDLVSLPEELRLRIRPFGLTYPCLVPSLLPRIAMPFLAHFSGLMTRLNFTSLLEDLRRFRGYIQLTKPRELVASRNSRKAGIIFQPRLWEEHEAPGENLAEVNGLRAALVKELRKEFGEAFIGGLVPTPAALRDYPELVARGSFRKPDYLALIQRSLIAVSTRGLFHSTPWKVAEYLAAGCCLLTETIRNELPEPLIEGKHLLNFSDVTSCVNHCKRLMVNEQLAQTMARDNHQYFQEHCTPGASMRRVLQTFRFQVLEI